MRGRERGGREGEREREQGKRERERDHVLYMIVSMLTCTCGVSRSSCSSCYEGCPTATSAGSCTVI